MNRVSYLPYNHVASNLNAEIPWRCAAPTSRLKDNGLAAGGRSLPLDAGGTGIKVNEILSLRPEANDSIDAIDVVRRPISCFRSGLIELLLQRSRGPGA